MLDFLASLDMTHISQNLSTVAVAVIAATLGIQKLMKSWKETSAETSVVTMMHTELTRLSEQNKNLAEELSKFQLEVIKLNRQVHELTKENAKLHDEVVRLQVLIAKQNNEKEEYGTYRSSEG